MSTELQTEIERIRSDFERLAVAAQRRDIERQILEITRRPAHDDLRNIATVRYEKSAR